MNIIYKYGLLPPLDWGEDCDAELRRMNALWNRLVEIDRGHRDRYRAVIATAGDGELTARLDNAVARLNALKDERKARRKAARRRIDAPDLDEAIESARSEYRALMEEVRADRAIARERVRAELAAIEKSRQAAVKLARQNSGLFWGNYNAICASYESARKRAITHGGELHFRCFAGEGRIVNQIQGGGTWEEALAGAINGQVSIRPHNLDRRRSGQLRPEYRLTATIFTRSGDGPRCRERRTVTWPLIMHRPLPDGAAIKEVAIKRVRLPGKGGRMQDRWQVTFLLRVPDAASETPAGEACGVDVGWRRMDDGMRVAMLVDERGHRQEFRLPEKMIAQWQFADEVASRRQTRVNEMITLLRALEWADAPPALRDAAQPLRSLPVQRLTARAVARLVALWRQTPEWQTETLAELSDLLADDWSDWRVHSAMLGRLAAWRRDLYRKYAAGLVRDFGLIGIEQLDLRQLAGQEANEDMPPASRQYRQIAAVGDLLASIEWAAAKAGARVHKHEGKSTWICADCGAETVPSDLAALHQTCGGCGAVWDVDVNAARNLLAAALASGEAGAESTAALAPEETTASAAGRWQRAKEGRRQKEALANHDVDHWSAS